MSKDKVILILLLALIVALAVVAWGLAGGQPSRGEGSLMKGGGGRTWLEDVIEDVHGSSLFPKPAPTRGDELAATGACLAAGALARVATVQSNPPCVVTVAERDGTRTRKLHVALTGGDKVVVTFKAEGGLPGKPKDVTLPQTLKTDDGGEETRRDIDLRVPEGGATLTLACLAGAPCKVTFDQLAPPGPK